MSGLLTQRTLIGAAAAAALAALAWLAGDLVVLGGARPLESAGARILVAALAVAGWAAWEIARARRARRDNERMLDVLAAGAAGDADSDARAAQELAVLRKRFEEAAQVLKSARFRGPDGEQRYVHELPWYMFIGAPGSGKTTALVNSGLHFPLKGAGADPSLAGVGGTRNCDWWFTDEAVLLDTAGRYTTQQSDARADAAAWLGFLDLLKRFRPRRPLNGALVTLSVSDLMLWTDEERAQYAQHVRARVAELRGRLGAHFPIYLLVTKADLVGGFMEFFGELDADARARVWGTTFTLHSGADAGTGLAQRFTREFAALLERLDAELLDRLQSEPDLQRRAAAYRFPQEFRGLGAPIDAFVEAAFGDGGAGTGDVPLRGVYFTSGTQEGSPIDRVLATLSRSFRLERAASAAPAGAGKSFFLKRLLKEVIFPESGLAGADPGVERALRRRTIAAWAALAAAAAGLGAAWTASYFGNREFVARAAAEAENAKLQLSRLGPPRKGDEPALLRVLNGLRALPGGYRDRLAGVDPAPGLGLSQAGKLGAQAVRAYRNALRDALFPRLALALEAEIREGLRAPKREGFPEALGAYASLFEGRKADAKLIEAAARRVWDLSDADEAVLLAHLRTGLEEGAPEMQHPRDEAIIREARQKLAAAKGG